jgi:hypothetical protein
MSQVRVYEDLLRSLHPLLDRQLAIQIEKVVSEVRKRGPDEIFGQESDDK